MWDNSKFEEAINRNIIVYDSDAKCGEFTLRHMALMKLHGRRNIDSKAKFKKMWLPRHIIDFIQNRDIDDGDLKDNIYGEDFGVLPSTVLDDYIYKYKASLAFCSWGHDNHTDIDLVIMEFDDGSYLLGSC